MTETTILDEEVAFEPEGFVCDTDWKADRCLADLGELATLEAWLKTDFERRMGQLKARREWLETGVRFYAETLLRESGGKQKRLSLPHGEAWFRKAAARVEVDDEDACLRYLVSRDLPGCTNVKITVAKPGLKAYMLDRDTGETREVPGARLVIPEGLQFGCKPRGSKEADE